MSHYTSIRTKYVNYRVLKKVINKLGHAYSENKSNETIEVQIRSNKRLRSSIYKNSYQNYLAFRDNILCYEILTDSQSWTKKEIINLFLNQLELNYGYLETIDQAFNLGFIRSKVATTKTNNKINRFIFQRYISTKIL
uniref:hypothetical protein n=1 Tax=Ascoseira mirabilis TaxID=76830 RepID=UPI00300139A2|nr:hypothetical protein ASMI167 [Ascoseira mirabilis]